VIEPLLEAERLLTLGLLDQAERIYRGVAEQDPRNSIAMTGLARVALERGDDVAALARSREALGIDPENAVAQRLVARLEEVARASAAQTSVARASAAQTSVARASAAHTQAGVPRPAPRPDPSPRRRTLLDRLRGRR
jgi:hypothetical protein